MFLLILAILISPIATFCIRKAAGGSMEHEVVDYGLSLFIPALAVFFILKNAPWPVASAIIAILAMLAVAIMAYRDCENLRDTLWFVVEEITLAFILCRACRLFQVGTFATYWLKAGPWVLMAIIVACMLLFVRRNEAPSRNATVAAIVAILLIAFVVATIFLAPWSSLKKATAPSSKSLATTKKDNEQLIIIADKLEEHASSFTDEQLIASFGEKRQFKPSSTLGHYEQRFDATGLTDAVTYDFYHEGENGWLSGEMLSNPIFLMGVDSALKEIDVVGQSNWSKEFSSNDDYNHWIEKTDSDWYVTDQYHLTACRYAMMLAGANYLGRSSNFGVVKHWPLRAELEKVQPSTEKDPYDFYVFEFVFKDGSKSYIGINVKDGRLAVLEPKAEATPSQPNPTPTPNPTPVDPTPTPQEPEEKPTPEPEPTPQEPDEPTPQEPKYHKDEEVIPDNQGNAPEGGTGTDGVDDDGPGELQKEKPVHVELDDDKTNDTRHYRPSTSEDKKQETPKQQQETPKKEIVVDENKPDESPIEIRHDTTVTDNKGETHNIDDEPTNTGEVSGF